MTRGLFVAMLLSLCALTLRAQAPRGIVPRPPAVVPAPPPAPAPPPPSLPQVSADLNQLMRGVFYPPSNVVFYAQAEDPTAVTLPPGQDPSMATDPLTSTYGGWLAVENAALALAESADLMSVAGRVCSNGVPVPVKDPAWTAFVREVRAAALLAYAAARSKDQEKMVAVAETMSTACGACHRKWRDRRPSTDRCK